MADKRISQLIERVDIANNDVLPIVASGATTTNKVTISTIQDWMQDNLDVGVTSVGITLGTSGTDVSVSGSPITTSGNITINIPDASASARGVVTTGSQTFAGVKTFANGLSLPAVGGSNQITRIVNIGTLHEGTASLNQIGFNSGNNIYFGKGLSNGGVLGWNNSTVRYYTLPDADGTLALASQIPTNPVGGTGTTNQIPKFTASSTIGNSNLSDDGSAVTCSTELRVLGTLNGTTASLTSTGTHLSLIRSTFNTFTIGTGTASGISGLLIGNNTAGTTPLIINQSNGAVTLSGALNGTSAVFTSASSNQLTLNGGTTIANRLLVARGTDDSSQNLLLGWNNITIQRTSVPLSSPQTEFSIIQQGSDASRTVFNIASTGAATFSSSVTTGGRINAGTGGETFAWAEFLEVKNSMRLWDSSNSSFGLRFGFSSNVPYLQGFRETVGVTNLALQPSGGNVGIGTASPEARLDIKDASAGGSIGMFIENTAASTLNNSADIYFGTWGGSSIGGVTNARISALNVNAGNAATDLLFHTYSGSASAERMRITSVGNTQPGADNAYSLGVSGTRWSAVWAANGTIQTSDEREKKDIVDSDLGLDFVNQLRPVSFKWKVGQNLVTSEVVKDEEGNPILDEEGNEKTESVIIPREGKRTHYGLIAQEVEELLDGKDFGGFIHDEETDTKGLRYDQFVPLLIKSIQELNAKIAILESKLK